MENFHYRAAKEYGPTLELMNSWHETLGEYENALGDQILPHINGEEPSVGILAIAAYRVGWFPFVEFPIERSSRLKGEIAKRGRKPREDLYLVRRRASCIRAMQLEHWDIEAKYFQPTIDALDIHDQLKFWLDEATEAVRTVRRRSKPATAMVFAALTTDSNDTSVSEESISTLQDLKSFGAHFSAVHLLPKDVWQKSQYAEGCPAVAIVGRHLH